MRRSRLLLALPILFLAGCGSTSTKGTVVASFEDVTADSEMMGSIWSDAVGGYRQLRSLSLTGLLSQTHPGEVCQSSSHRPSSATICYAAEGGDRSYYRTRTIGEEVELSDVTQTKLDLLKLIAAAEKMLEQRLAQMQNQLAEQAAGLDPDKKKDDKQAADKKDPETDAPAEDQKSTATVLPTITASPNTATAVDAAQSAAKEAQVALKGAVEAQQGAESAKDAAVAAQNKAVAAKEGAVEAQNQAVKAKDQAVVAKGQAEEAQKITDNHQKQVVQDAAVATAASSLATAEEQLMRQLIAEKKAENKVKLDSSEQAKKALKQAKAAREAAEKDVTSKKAELSQAAKKSTATKRALLTPGSAVAVAQAEADYNTLLNDLINKISKPGVMVFYWTATNSLNTSGVLGPIFSGSLGKQEHWEGFGVVGGIRATTLFLGQDIHQANWAINNPDGLFNGLMIKVPTTLYQAKYITYFSALERITQLKAKLKTTIDDLKKIVAKNAAAAAWVTAQSLRIEMNLSKMSKIVNSATMAAGKINTSYVNWDKMKPSPRCTESGGNMSCRIPVADLATGDCKLTNGRYVCSQLPENREPCDAISGECTIESEMPPQDETERTKQDNKSTWLTFYEVSTRLHDLQDLVTPPGTCQNSQ